MAVVDAEHQIIVHAHAYGEGQEHGLLIPMLEGVGEAYRELELSDDVLQGLKVVADAGLHSEANLKYLAEKRIDGYVADTMFRQRDARFADAARHKPPKHTGKRVLFRPQQFRCAADMSHCICPAGKRLYRNGGNVTINGYSGVKFHGAQRDCGACALRDRCLKYPDRTPARQVVIFRGRAAGKPPTFSALMKHKIDTEHGRHCYSRRLAIVEPVFGNIRNTRGLDRFTLRGKRKVNNQWLLYAMVHNIGKLQRYGKFGSTTRQKGQ